MNRSVTRNRQSPGGLGDADTLDTALITAIHNMVSTKVNPKTTSGYSNSGKQDSQIGSLLSAGANPDCRDDRGRPAVVAALDGSVAGPDLLRQLLAAGASPDLAIVSTDSCKGDKSGRGSSSQSGLTALHCAARRGYQVCVNLLLSAGADVNLGDSRDNTALMKASKAGHSPTVNTLLQEGADVAQVNANLQTALHAAAQRPGNVEVVFLLLESGAPLHATDADGQTALIYASRDRHTDLVEILLEDLDDNSYYQETGTYWLNSVDKKTGKTALHYSVESAHVKGVQLLIDRGADMNVKDATWRTPFFYALESVDSSTTASKRNTLTSDMDLILKELIEAGCDVVGTDRSFNTTLHLAARRGFCNIVEIIAQTGMSIDVKGGKDGITPLMIAAQCGHLSTVNCLLELGANPDSVDRHNASSLAYAILSKSFLWNDKMAISSSPSRASMFSSGSSSQNVILEIMKTLLRFNSNPDLRCSLSLWKEMDGSESFLDFEIDSERMYSPLELTFLTGKPDLFLLLVKSGCSLNNFDMDAMMNEYERCNNNIQVGCMDDTTLRYLQEVIRTYRANVPSLAELCCRPALTNISRMTSLANIKKLDLISLLPNYKGSFESVYRTSLSEEQMDSIQDQLRHVLMLSKLDETAAKPHCKQEIHSRTKERLKVKRNEQKYRSDGKIIKKSTSMTLNPLESEVQSSLSSASPGHLDGTFTSPAPTLSDSVFED